jgi:hypothetical protein
VKAARALLVACALALAVSGSAAARTSNDFVGQHRQVFRVVVVKGLTLGDLPQLATEGAVGLMVPNSGPRTSQAAAFAGMVRGILYNTRLPRPHDAVLIHVTQASEIPAHGPVIVVGLPPATTAPNDRRYPIAVIGHGYHGLLVSSLTRVPGLVSIADVARTALQTSHSLSTKRDDGPVATSYQLEDQIDVARSTTMPGSVLVMSLLVFFALLFPRGTPTAFGAAIAVNLVMGWFPTGDAAPRVTLLGLCTIAGGLFGPTFFRKKPQLGVALVVLLAAYAISMIVRPSTLSLAPIGPELTSRFFGVSNLLETWLLYPALLGAALLAKRFGPLAFLAIGGLALATIAENALGADGGGAIVVGVAFALLAVELTGARRRYILPALAAAAFIVFSLGIMNVAANRVPLAYARMVEQWWLLIPGLAAVIVCVAVARRGGSRIDRAVATALLGGLAASLLVNDSPGPVMIGGLAAVLAIEGGICHRALTLPVLRRLAPPVAAAVPQEP